MANILFTAIAVGTATMIGAIIGICCKPITHKWNDIMLGFAAGIMLGASLLGLVLPATEIVDKKSVIYVVIAIIMGAVFLTIIDKCMPQMPSYPEQVAKEEKEGSYHALGVFLIGIALHNLPEGMAAGISFGSENIKNTITVVTGVAIQNIPEGIVFITPLMKCGISKKRAVFISLGTAVLEVIGTLFGFFAVHISSLILPYLLALAGGTILYVVSDEMIPDTHGHGNERAATYAIIIGFTFLLLFDILIG